MQKNKWFGWETLLAFSMYGGALRVLPVPGLFVWGIVLAAFGCAVFWAVFLVLKNGIETPPKSVAFVCGFFVLILWTSTTLLWSPILVSQLVAGDLYILLVAIIPTIMLAAGGSVKAGMERRWLFGITLATSAISCYCLFLWLSASESLYTTLREMALDDESLGGIYLASGQALMTLSIASFVCGMCACAWRKTGFAISALAFLLALDSGARGPVVCGILTIALFSMLELSKKKTPIIYLLLVIGGFFIATAAAGFILIDIDVNVLNLPILNRFASDSDRGYDEFSSIGMRLNYYDQALSMFYDSPLLGQGVLGFRSLSDSSSIYPHNFFLDALGDLGIIGFFLTFFLVFQGAAACWDILANTDDVFKKICAALFIYFIGMEMSSGYLYWSWVWPWALVVIQLQPKTKQKRTCINE